MNNIIRVVIAVLIIAILSVCMTGCYSFEELQTEAEYEKQAKINAVEYIKEKYGFEPRVLNVDCPKSFNWFDAYPNSQVYVKMRYDKKTFYTLIKGSKVTTEGRDNYQYEELKSALKQKLSDATNISIEELSVIYGYNITDDPTNDKNGMISPYYNGNNLLEVFKDTHPYVVASVIEQDISSFQADMIKDQTGIGKAIFVNYDNKKHYNIFKLSYLNIMQDIEDALIYINDYRIIEDTSDQYYTEEDTSDQYYRPKTAEYDGVIIATVDDCESLSLEKTEMDPADNWSDQGFKHPVKLCDAYAINTDAETIQIFIPISDAVKLSPHFTDIAIQYNNEYDTLWGDVTDDYKYITTTIHCDGKENIKVTAMIDFWEIFI